MRKPRTLPKPDWRDQVALQVMAIFMADTSRQLTGGLMPLDDAPRAVDRIAHLSYAVADAMLIARSAKT